MLPDKLQREKWHWIARICGQELEGQVAFRLLFFRRPDGLWELSDGETRVAIFESEEDCLFWAKMLEHQLELERTGFGS